MLLTVHWCYVLYIFDHTIQHKDDRFASNATFGAVGRNSIVFLLSLLPMLTAKCGNTKPKKSKGELWWLNLTSRKLDLTKILFLFTLEWTKLWQTGIIAVYQGFQCLSRFSMFNLILPWSDLTPHKFIFCVLCNINFTKFIAKSSFKSIR